MRRALPPSLLSTLTAAAFSGPLAAAPPPLLPQAVVAALAEEVSGSAALATAQELTLYHRQRGSRGYSAAAEAVRRRAEAAGLAGVEILHFPADGEIFYGTQRSRPAWDADFAELWELEQAGDGTLRRTERVASWEAQPITLAQDSASGSATTTLMDVGEGTSEADYAGKDVAGKLVLAAAQPGAVSELAVDRFGAAGIVSYAQNQKSAWWKEDETLIRWGHLSTFPAPETFAFMVSLKQARAWRERLARGEAVHLAAEVRAGQHPGAYEIPTALIPGTDPTVAAEEILFSCHLDHQKPGANDNASGCAAILEAARALAKLVREGRIPPPRRTLRFVWPPEIEGTLALVGGRPELAARVRAVIHMDMVGGDPAVTKAVFHLTRSPKSLPSFVNGVAEAFGAWVNAETDRFAGGADSRWSLIDPAGGKEPLRAAVVDFTPGSDHQVWTEGSFRVPALYFNDWPDRYIHTHRDSIDHLDATKLKRVAFLGAASGYSLAQLGDGEVPQLLGILEAQALRRLAGALERCHELTAAGEPAEAANLLDFHLGYEDRVLASVAGFAALTEEQQRRMGAFSERLAALAAAATGSEANPGGEARAESEADPAAAVVYRRAAEPKGTMDGFAYSWLAERLEEHDLERPELASYEGLWGDGYLYAYEALNLVDGRRTVGEVRDALAAIYGPLPLALVVEYLEALERVGLLVR